MTLGQLAPIVIGTAVQVGFHYYLWRRLVRDPGWSALTDVQKSRCSLPGLSDWPMTDVVISKSKFCIRF